MPETIKNAYVQQVSRILRAGERLAHAGDPSFLYEVQACIDVLVLAQTPQPSAMMQPSLNTGVEPARGATLQDSAQQAATTPRSRLALQPPAARHLPLAQAQKRKR